MPDSGSVPSHDEGLAHVRRWRRYSCSAMSASASAAISSPLCSPVCSPTRCSFPKGLLPQGYEIAVVQSRFFEVSWGWWGKALFLIVAAAFLSDTWLATVDAVSRIHTDCVYGFFPKVATDSLIATGICFSCCCSPPSPRSPWVLLDEPGPLILVSAVIGFIGTVMYLGRADLPQSCLSAAPSARAGPARPAFESDIS